MANIGRNDSCPCGSNKKYKKCCLPKAYTEIGREETIKQRLVQDILRLAKGKFVDRLDEAYDYFWSDFDPEEYLTADYLQSADINFWEWVVHDWVPDDDGKALIDYFIEGNKNLSPDELKILNMMNHSVISLYEVQEVFPEKGLILKDLLMGDEYDVREKMATRSLRKWDIFATRLIHLDGRYIMSGCVYPYPVNQKESIINYINDTFEGFRKDYPDAAIDDFLKSEGDIFNFHWYDQIQNPPQFGLATTTGETFRFSKSVFEIKDKEDIIKKLKKIKDIEPKDNGFLWLSKEDKDGRSTILGNIKIEGDELILECNSGKRLEKGKALISKHLSGSVAHKTDTFQNPMEVMKSVKELPKSGMQNKIPMEIQQKVYNDLMQRHYERWLYEKIPALNNKTPMDAIKTDAGRMKVIELLKSIENHEEHSKRDGRPHYDISWMWERLGVEREESV